MGKKLKRVIILMNARRVLENDNIHDARLLELELRQAG